MENYKNSKMSKTAYIETILLNISNIDCIILEAEVSNKGSHVHKISQAIAHLLFLISKGR
jgi:hypothetical protein